MTTPHKHAALICRWADGAVIECQNSITGAWDDMGGPGGDRQPAWLEDFEYRIKPAPVLSKEAQLLIHRLQGTARADRITTCGSLQERAARQDMRDAEQAMHNYILNLEQQVKEPT